MFIATSMPLRTPPCFAPSNNLLNPSTGNKKWNGDRGNHCLVHIWASQKGKVHPLIKATNYTLVIHPITQFMKGTPNPGWVRIILI